MLLYTFPRSPNPRRVQMFIVEKGVEVPTIVVNIASKEQLTPGFRAINPRCVVPALVLDDGAVVCESLAICRYLEEMFPHPPLMGLDEKDKAMVSMWERRMELDGLLPAIEAHRNSAKSFAGHAVVGPHKYEQIPMLVARGKARLANFYVDLDERLRAYPYVAGGRFTIADITAFVTIEFATSRIEVEAPHELSSLHAWRARLAERPSARIEQSM